jgi:hypothetical protein
MELCPSVHSAFVHLSQRHVVATMLSTLVVCGGYFAIGIVGYSLGEEEEGWTAIDAFYFTMMTCTTVGCTPTTSERHPRMNTGHA